MSDGNDNESSLEKFKSFTGCTNDAEAQQLLEACGDNIEMAIDLYFQQRPSTTANSPSPPPAPSASGSSARYFTRSSTIPSASGTGSIPGSSSVAFTSSTRRITRSGNSTLPASAGATAAGPSGRHGLTAASNGSGSARHRQSSTTAENGGNKTRTRETTANLSDDCMVVDDDDDNNSNNNGNNNNNNDNNNNNGGDDDVVEVRAPIAPVRGAIVEQTFRQQYEIRGRRRGLSVFDSFRDFRGESDVHLAAFQNGTANATVASSSSASSASSSLTVGPRGVRRSLQVLFRPPLELMFRGDWESARDEARRRRMWLIVNVQDVREFVCQTLNRDVWSNAAVKELVRSNFIFWQIFHDSADGIRIINYYRITSYPSIFVVDPRTGELLVKFRAPDAVSFCDQVTTFLESFPDFAARDRYLIGATAPTASVETTSPKSSESSSRQITDSHEGPSSSSSSSNGHRKRALLGSQNSDGDDHDERESKKSRKGDDMPDIDAMVSGVSKTTTVDRDEWRSYMGVADGKGHQISLMLRLPDGSRQTMEVEDTTPLRAVLMLIAGLGFSPCEHLLVLSYPKRQYSFEDADRTLRELKLSKRELIHVESK